MIAWNITEGERAVREALFFAEKKFTHNLNQNETASRHQL